MALVRMWGGSLQSLNSRRIDETTPKSVRYNLELTFRAFEVAARDLNHAIESITKLAHVGGELENFHMNIESVEEKVVQSFLSAA